MKTLPPCIIEDKKTNQRRAKERIAAGLDPRGGTHQSTNTKEPYREIRDETNLSQLYLDVQSDPGLFVMNTSKQADAAFMDALKLEDPKRYSRLIANIKQDGGTNDSSMKEDQALTNFQLGKSTGGFRFGYVAGPHAFKSPARRKLDAVPATATNEEYIEALLAFVNEKEYDLQPTLPVIETKMDDAARRKHTRKLIKKARMGRKSASKS